MNDPALIARVVSGRRVRHLCFPMPCRPLGCRHGAFSVRCVAMPGILQHIARAPNRPVPAVIGGQTLGDQMVKCAAAPGDHGCGPSVFGLAPGLLKQRILPTVQPRGLTRGRDR